MIFSKKQVLTRKNDYNNSTDYYQYNQYGIPEKETNLRKKIIMVDTMSMITTNMVLNKGLVHTKKTIMVVMICTDITSMVSKKKVGTMQR